ncbi:MAG: DMT family transporter [Weeksellaceae bacterium]
MKLGDNKYILLLILALVWGSSFILIKNAVAVFTPYQVGGLRLVIAGLSLMIIGIPALKRLPRKTIQWMLVAGFFGNFMPMFLFPMAQVKVSSSLAGILNSLVPVFTLIFGYIIFKISHTRLQIIGAILGLIGANLLMYFSNGGGDKQSNFLYALLIVLATTAYALSGLIVKAKLNHVKSLELSAGMFTLWFVPGIVILIISGFFSDFESTEVQWRGLGYVSILAIVGTAIAMIMFYKLIQQTTAVFASSVTYLMPIVAIGWGLLSEESFNLWFVLGGLLIFVGIYLIRERNL